MFNVFCHAMRRTSAERANNYANTAITLPRSISTGHKNSTFSLSNSLNSQLQNIIGENVATVSKLS